MVEEVTKNGRPPGWDTGKLFEAHSPKASSVQEWPGPSCMEQSFLYPKPVESPQSRVVCSITLQGQRLCLWKRVLLYKREQNSDIPAGVRSQLSFSLHLPLW